MSQSLSTPVLLLLFNRPETTRQVMAEIRKARPARLYVAADGPRPDVQSDAVRCAQAREILNDVDWPCEVKSLLRDTNIGCKIAVSSALDWFFGYEEEGIVLEDDCVPAQDFFGFCHHLLAHYREEPRVKMISGTNVLLGAFPANSSYVFSRYFSVWGWATWRRVWEEYDIGMPDWPRLKEAGWLRQVYSPRYMQRHLENMFDLVHSGRINTWDAQFMYSCLRNDGVAAVPSANLISNIGVQGTHTAPGATAQNFLPVSKLDVNHLKHPESIDPDERHDLMLYERLFKPTFRGWIRTTSFRVLRRVKKQFSRHPPQPLNPGIDERGS